jgi:SAM-dependent methyltransferase
MDQATYAAEAEIEQDHWWFVGRRKLFGWLIRALDLPRDVRALDAGTSTGTNLRLLRDLGFTNVEGVDISPEAKQFCERKQLGIVTIGDLCALPYADNQFDLVLATDVIEHLDDDGRAVAELIRVLKPGGHVLITVPAFPSLWGLQDIVAHHKRRYRKRPLLQLLGARGLQCRQAFYFNFVLFAPIWLARQFIRLAGLRLRSENDVNTSSLNRVLRWIFTADVWSARWLSPPFGVSILALCTKPESVALQRTQSHAA